MQVNSKRCAWLMLLAVSCGDKDDVETGVVGAGAEPCGEPCALTDAHNFTYTTDLQFEVMEAEALADVCLDWSGLSTDIQGHPVTEGIDEIRLAVFGSLTYDEIREGLSSDQLQQSDLSLFMECHPDSDADTECCLSEFGLLGSYPGIDQYFEVGSGNWMLIFGSDDVEGARTIVMIVPSDTSDASTIEIGDNTASLSMDVDLSSGLTAQVAATGDITLDWSELTRDGLGNELALQKINSLELAHYASTPEELAENFFDLRSLATETWSMSVSGETLADLSLLDGAAPFTGVTSDGTWLLALWCTVCENPVPKAIIRLAPLE